MAVGRLVAAVALISLAFGADAQWREGVHYETIPGAQQSAADEPIEVLYAFWYACPTCFNFEPHMKRWLETKPDDVNYVRVAASMAPSWRVHARAYYTADALDVVDKVHGELFNAIHLHRNALNTVDAIAAVFERHAGIDREAFTAAYGSFGVDARMRRGDQQTRRYRLTAVPSIVVAGKYRTDPGRAQGLESMVRLVDHLIELERAERRGSTTEPEMR